MAKIKVSADTVLSILKGIMEDGDINSTITDVSAPKEWQGKKVQDILNVDYYTFKHRPVDTEVLVQELAKQGQDTNVLYALTRAFCILSLNSTERVFSKNNDIVNVSANLEYWLQTDKVKLLEDMLEDIAIETSGIRIPVQIGAEKRQVLLALGSLNISEIDETTEFGEMSVCDIDIDIVFYPNAYSKSDYIAEFAVSNQETGSGKWVELPFSSLSISNTMTQKSVPIANRVRSVGNINLSRARTFTFSFDGYYNDFIDQLVAQTYIGDVDENGNETDDMDNNQALILRLTRGEQQYIYNCVIKEHTVSVQEDTGNETHSLILTTRGMKDGTT